MPSNIQIKSNIDTDITNKITVSSINPPHVGNSIKQVIDYVDQEINTVGENIIKTYKALITQTGTNDPTLIIFNNTFGSPIVWTRQSAGIYYGTLNGAFTNLKTWSIISSINYGALYEIYPIDENTIRIRTVSSDTFTLVDGQLNKTPIKIDIHN